MTRIIALTLLATLGLVNPVAAQSPCNEAGDAPYFQHMGEAREAIEAERYDEALVHLQWARERYTFALLHYSEARALQHLGRYAEAAEAYERFIRTGLPCADFDNLRARARAYRNELLEIIEEDAENAEVAEAPDMMTPVTLDDDELGDGAGEGEADEAEVAEESVEVAARDDSPEVEAAPAVEVGEEPTSII